MPASSLDTSSPLMRPLQTSPSALRRNVFFGVILLFAAALMTYVYALSTDMTTTLKISRGAASDFLGNENLRYLKTSSETMADAEGGSFEERVKDIHIIYPRALGPRKRVPRAPKLPDPVPVPEKTVDYGLVLKRQEEFKEILKKMNLVIPHEPESSHHVGHLKSFADDGGTKVAPKADDGGTKAAPKKGKSIADDDGPKAAPKKKMKSAAEHAGAGVKVTETKEDKIRTGEIVKVVIQAMQKEGTTSEDAKSLKEGLLGIWVAQQKVADDLYDALRISGILNDEVLRDDGLKLYASYLGKLHEDSSAAIVRLILRSTENQNILAVIVNHLKTEREGFKHAWNTHPKTRSMFMEPKRNAESISGQDVNPIAKKRKEA